MQDTVLGYDPWPPNVGCVCVCKGSVRGAMREGSDGRSHYIDKA